MLLSEERSELSALVLELNPTGAARELKVHRETLLNVVRGKPLRHGTVMMMRTALDRLRAERTARTNEVRR